MSRLLRYEKYIDLANENVVVNSQLSSGSAQSSCDSPEHEESSYRAGFLAAEKIGKENAKRLTEEFERRYESAAELEKEEFRDRCANELKQCLSEKVLEFQCRIENQIGSIIGQFFQNVTLDKTIFSLRGVISQIRSTNSEATFVIHCPPKYIDLLGNLSDLEDDSSIALVEGEGPEITILTDFSRVTTRLNDWSNILNSEVPADGR